MYGDNEFSIRGQNPDRSIPRFHMRAVEMPFLSEQAGRPIYEDRQFVEIITPGHSKSVACEPVNDEHKARWPTQFAAFVAGLEAPTTGTPLEQFSALTPSQVLNFKALHIRTVEDLAGVSDSVLQNMGPGARDYRTKAARYLDGAKATADASAAEARAERAEAESERLKDVVADLASRLEALESKKAGGKRSIDAGSDRPLEH